MPSSTIPRSLQKADGLAMTEAQTSNPLISLNIDADELILNLQRIQPKLHKRLTEKLKRRQEAYIHDVTRKLFDNARKEE